jgi:tetratricopeptide (TPR) repeat protein
MDYDRLRELQEKFDENPRRYFAPLANEYRKGGQPKRAIEICRAHLAQMPGHMSGQIVFGQSLFEAGEYAEARQVFERALVLDPENLIALRSLGDMSLQNGDTTEARSWYTRLLDADPKDTTVIALVSEIDASGEATPAEAVPSVPGSDVAAGDQQIPFIADVQNEATAAAANAQHSETPASPETKTEWTAPQPAASEAPSPAAAKESEIAPPMPSELDSARDVAPPMPSELASMREEVAPPMPSELANAREEDASSPPLGLERHYPAEQLSQDEIETLGVTAERTPLVSRKIEVNEPLVSRRDEAENPLDNWDVPDQTGVQEDVAPAASASADYFELNEPAEDAAEPAATEAAPAAGESAFSGASAEPFVNETMAQLYLKQGYTQLALQVYHRLAEARPDDQRLKDRIAEIEASERAAPAKVEAPGDSPPPSPTEREPVESPTRDEPRAEPEAVAARQPSVREFFATLGRRRPPRAASPSRSSQGGGGTQGNNAAPETTTTQLGAPASTASLDAVFAGAEVSASDSRAASRLAGAFSGTGRSTTPQTPPVPTPRINPRLQTQESEEDVAKFRAWLDGLTGE